VAKRTPGFSGADLANVLNEAALLTAREGAKVIDNRILDEAIDRVIAGPQKRTRLMNDKERLVTAYHEGGHALVAAAMNQTDPVTKVTILPRGRALGYTMVLPSEDKYSTTRNELLDQLAYAMGGRVAEEIVFHDPTTGASNDIEKATNIARKMVTQYGMSEKLGMVKIGDDQSEPFAGRGYGGGDEYGDSTLSSIDRRGPRAHRLRPRRCLLGADAQPRCPRQSRLPAARTGDPRPGGTRGDLRRRRQTSHPRGVAGPRRPSGVRTRAHRTAAPQNDRTQVKVPAAPRWTPPTFLVPVPRV
jgi:hypothetical protein